MVDNNILFQPGHPNYDPCAKFIFIVDHANNVFQRHYVPHEQLCIDESLVGTNCQTAIKQYLPNKKNTTNGASSFGCCAIILQIIV